MLGGPNYVQCVQFLNSEEALISGIFILIKILCKLFFVLFL